MARSHGPNYSPAAVRALRPLDLGPWEQWHPPVPSCAAHTAPCWLGLC